VTVRGVKLDRSVLSVVDSLLRDEKEELL